MTLSLPPIALLGSLPGLAGAGHDLDLDLDKTVIEVPGPEGEPLKLLLDKNQTTLGVRTNEAGQTVLFNTVYTARCRTRKHD